MSVPKPIVRRVPGAWLAWQWTCCEVESKAWADWEFAQRDADRHSRTHTAERIVEELERHARRQTQWVDDHARRNVPTMAARAQGEHDGATLAANLIREHLVKEAA